MAAARAAAARDSQVITSDMDAMRVRHATIAEHVRNIADFMIEHDAVAGLTPAQEQMYHARMRAMEAWVGDEVALGFEIYGAVLRSYLDTVAAPRIHSIANLLVAMEGLTEGEEQKEEPNHPTRDLTFLLARDSLDEDEDLDEEQQWQSRAVSRMLRFPLGTGIADCADLFLRVLRLPEVRANVLLHECTTASFASRMLTSMWVCVKRYTSDGDIPPLKRILEKKIDAMFKEFKDHYPGGRRLNQDGGVSPPWLHPIYYMAHVFKRADWVKIHLEAHSVVDRLFSIQEEIVSTVDSWPSEDRVSDAFFWWLSVLPPPYVRPSLFHVLSDITVYFPTMAAYTEWKRDTFPRMASLLGRLMHILLDPSKWTINAFPITFPGLHDPSAHDDDPNNEHARHRYGLKRVRNILSPEQQYFYDLAIREGNPTTGQFIENAIMHAHMSYMVRKTQQLNELQRIWTESVRDGMPTNFLTSTFGIVAGYSHDLPGSSEPGKDSDISAVFREEATRLSTAKEAARLQVVKEDQERMARALAVVKRRRDVEEEEKRAVAARTGLRLRL